MSDEIEVKMELLDDKKPSELDGQTIALVFACTQYVQTLNPDFQPSKALANYWLDISEVDGKNKVFFRAKRTEGEIGLYGGVTSLGSHMEFIVDKELMVVENLRLFR